MRPGVRAPALAAGTCVLALFVVLAAAYAVPPFPRLDAIAMNGLGALQGPLASPVLLWVVGTADPVPLAALLAVLCIAGIAAGRRRQVATAVVAVAAANVLTQVLKIVLAHPRYQPVLIHPLEARAFPSGHATAAMSIALAAVIVAPPRWRMVVAPLACAYAAIVATGVVILFWHFPSDALAGLLVASGCAFAAVAVSRALAGGASDLTPIRTLWANAPPPGIWAAAAALAAAVALARSADLAAFAMVNTTATAAALVTLVAAIALTASASFLADS